MKFWRTVALVSVGILAIGGVIYIAWCSHYKAEADRNWQNYVVQQGITETNADLYRQAKIQWEEKMAELMGMVDSAATIIAESEEARAESEAALEGLETLRPLLSDKDAIIQNLDEQIVVYKKMVSEFKLTIEQKDVQIFSLTRQVRETGQMLQASEAQTRAEKELRLSAERGWSLERIQVQVLRRQGRTSRALAAGSLVTAGVAQISGASATTSLLSGLATSVITYIFIK